MRLSGPAVLLRAIGQRRYGQCTRANRRLSPAHSRLRIQRPNLKRYDFHEDWYYMLHPSSYPKL